MSELQFHSPCTVAIATMVGFAALTSPPQYPIDQSIYVLRQDSGTYSDVLDNITHADINKFFLHRLAELYQDFARQQIRLDPEFEDAIFNNLENLYVM